MQHAETVMVDTPNGTHRVRVAGEGPPLLVVPGGPGFGATYLIESVGGLLGDCRRLVFVDQRGAGGSPVGNGDLSIEAYVDDTVAIADELGIERFDIMGHSFGGLQTMLVAAKNGNRVDRVILIDGDAPTCRLFKAGFAPGTPIHERTRPEDLEEQAAITAAPDWMFDQDKLNRWIILEFRPFYEDPSTSARIPHDFTGARHNQWKITSSTVRSALGDWDITPLLPAVTNPVLLVYCRDSILGPDVPATYHDLLPNSHLVWVDGGHDPPAEDPEAFGAAARSFLGCKTSPS